MPIFGNMEQFFSWLRNHLRPSWHALNKIHIWRWIILGVILFLIYLAASDLLVLALFIAIGAISFLPARVTSAVGFELLTILTVAAGVGMGPLAGLLVGVVGSLLGSFVRGDTDPSIIISIVEYAFIGIGAGMISAQSFVIYGILATFIYDVILVSAYTMLLGKDFVKTGMYFITHLLINALLFLRLKTFVLGLV